MREYPTFRDPLDEIYFEEHILRYQFALPYIQGKVVLDIGCGARRGPFLLTQKAHLVIGTDVSQQAVQESAKTWKAPQLFYAVMDTHLACFHENTFDAVTCFEVIEHLLNPSVALSEIARVLRPGGLLVLSTPNKIRMEDQGEINPHHIHEFSKEDLESLLSSRFSQTEFFSLIRTPRTEALLEARKKSYRLTRLDPPGLRRFVPRALRKRFYDRLTLLFAGSKAEGAVHLNPFDVQIVSGAKQEALYFIGVCQNAIK